MENIAKKKARSRRYYMKESSKEKRRKYRQLPHVKKAARKYYQENKERILEQQKKNLDPEKAKKYKRKYKKTLRGKIMHKYHTMKRRLLLKQGDLTIKDLNEIHNNNIEKYSILTCEICNKWIKDKWHYDHKYPVSRGGFNTKTNIQITCEKCNLKKSNKVPRDLWFDGTNLKMRIGATTYNIDMTAA